jgi:hypothetical protein
MWLVIRSICFRSAAISPPASLRLASLPDWPDARYPNALSFAITTRRGFRD